MEGERRLGTLQAAIFLFAGMVLLGWLYLMLIGVPEALKPR